MTHSKIQNQINELKIDANTEEMEALNILHDQFNRAGSAGFSTEELSDLLKTEDDCLDGLDQDSGFSENVRSIQDQIIAFFGE